MRIGDGSSYAAARSESRSTLLSLALEHADVKSQRYTVCLCVNDQCLKLRNRTVNEVVSFVMSERSVLVELVATKVLRDQIVGYLAVPSLDHP